MRFTMDIKSDNAVVLEAPFEELHRAMGNALRRIDTGDRSGVLLDSNGNSIGGFDYTPGETEG